MSTSKPTPTAATTPTNNPTLQAKPLTPFGEPTENFLASQTEVAKGEPVESSIIKPEITWQLVPQFPSRVTFTRD